MSKVKVALGVVGGLVGLVVVGGFGGLTWANAKVDSVFAETWETHEADFPVPFPLTEAEIEALRAEKLAALPEPPAEGVDVLADVDLAAIAAERAIARGEHYTNSIYVCTACHGANFGGGVMLDEAPIGTVKGPNLTARASKEFSVADWDRAVRHGVLPGGATSIMPVLDFKHLSDRELSDMIAYIRSVPAVDGGATVREWGPMGKMLIATGTLVPDVYKVADHQAAHPGEPPPIGPTVEYGEHITTVCTGCHRETFNGGPMPFGPPDWPPAGNLTPHEAGLGAYSYDDFLAVMKRGKKKNGEPVKVPMAEILPYSANMTDDELQAMWAYLSQLPPTPTGE